MNGFPRRCGTRLFRGGACRGAVGGVGQVSNPPPAIHYCHSSHYGKRGVWAGSGRWLLHQNPDVSFRKSDLESHTEPKSATGYRILFWASGCASISEKKISTACVNQIKIPIATQVNIAAIDLRMWSCRNRYSTLVHRPEIQ